MIFSDLLLQILAQLIYSILLGNGKTIFESFPFVTISFFKLRVLYRLLNEIQTHWFMNTFKIVAVSLFCCFTLLVNAQQTYKYLDPLLTYKQAQEYFRLGNYTLAQESFRNAIEVVDPPKELSEFHKMDAAYQIAMCSKALAKPDVVYLFSQFVEEYGNNRYYNSLANYQLGKIFYDKRQYRATLSCFEEIFEDDLAYDDYEHFKFMQAYSNFNLKQFDEAYKYFDIVARMKGEHYIDASYYLGYLAFEEGDYDKAVRNFLVVENTTRYKNIIPYYVTQIYYKQGNADKILSYTIPKLDQPGLKYKTQMNKIVGQTYYDRKQFAEALPYLAYYVEYSNKVSKEDLYLLAYTQYQFGKYEDAIENFLELNTLTDEFGQNAVYHLADCYIKVGDKEKARNAFKQASELDADQEIKRVSAFNFGKLSYELGNQTDALNSILAFISDYPTAPENNEAKSLLAEILEQTSNYSQAIEIIESIPNKNQSLKNTYQRITYAKAIDFYGANKMEQALMHFEKSLTYPNDRQLVAQTHFWKGQMYYAQNNFGQCEKELNKYLASPGQSNEKVSPGIAHYTIAYGYFTEKQYNKALPHFEKVPTTLVTSSSNDKIYADALLRNGDCYFINRKYKQAEGKYQKVISRKMDGADYATYQTGMIAGLEQDYNKKIQILEGLSKSYPKSYYSDDALYQTANTHSLQQNYNESIIALQKLIEEYPKSKFYQQALVDLGVMFFNIDEYDPAITYYDKVIKEFPNTPEAQQAVINLKEVYMAKGDSDAYFDYIESAPEIEISTSGQDTIMYQFAESFYEKGNCLEAVTEFNKYLKAHPRGAYVLYAHFYRGDCLYQRKRYSQARDDFDFIVKQKSNIFTEKSLMRGARIAFVVDKNDEKAFQYYKRLLSIASQPEITTEALKGLTKSAYSLKRDDDVINYGNKLLADRRASSKDKLEANFFLAKIAYRKGEITQSQNNFKQVAIKDNGELGAEARYLLAEMLYTQNKLVEAKEACFRIDRETPEQEYWVVKSFILLGDIYAKKGELYQAKQTLKSIVDNYEGDAELKADAERKLADVMAKEKAKSKLEEETEDSNQLELDEDN